MRRVLAALALAACGPSASGGAACRADGGAGLVAELGTVDTSGGNVYRMGANAFLEVPLNEDASPDLLHLELYAGNGVFRGGSVHPGSFTLSGAELAYDTCGVCVLVQVNRHPDTLEPEAYYMPVSGQVTLTRVDSGLTGTLDDITLRHVRIDFRDPDGPGPLKPTLATTPVDDGCSSHLGHAAFDMPYDDTPDAGR
jgi:hypothetical protein